MTATHACAPVPAYRIYLVDKNNARSLLLGLFKHVPHSGSTHTNKHFHKIRTRNTEERDLGFTGNRFRKESFTGTRLANHQDATRNPAT